MKIVLWIALLALSTAIAACGSAEMPTASPATATPTAASTDAVPTETVSSPALTPTGAPDPTASEGTATGTPPVPTVSPTSPAPTESPTVEVPSDHPAAPLALLPGRSRDYLYINLERVSQRAELRDHVEFQLSHFVSGDEQPFAEELLLTTGARALALSTPFSSGEWICVLWGDFGPVAAALGMAAESETGLSVSVVETHREVDIYSLIRTRSSGYETEIHLAVPSGESLVASPDRETVREVIDRHLDGGDLPRSLTTMVEDFGLGDYFFAASLEGLGDAQEGPVGAARFVGYHATLEEGATTSLRGAWQFEGEEQAALAAVWLQDQPEPHWRNIGWGQSVQIDGWQRRGSTVYGEATVPDEDVPNIVQGN